MDRHQNAPIFDPTRIVMGLGYACTILVAAGWLATLSA